MGGYVDRLREKSPPIDCVAPPGEAKINFDASAEVGKLFGPILIGPGDGGSAPLAPQT